MLTWVCALHCEAKPVIDLYRLKKSPQKTEFDLYQNSDISCIVSGMGADNMTRAVQWANNQFHQQNELCWINLGIAGHKNLSVGTSVLISQASLSENTDPLNTQTDIKHSFVSKSLISITHEKTEYLQDFLLDMEAHAFMTTTRAFSPRQLCQSIKVISDNSESPPTRNKAKISQLIADNMPQISEFACLLQKSITTKRWPPLK